MCIIVDNNVIQRVLLGSNDHDFAVLHLQVVGTKQPLQRLLYGGKLLDEYRENGKVHRMLLALDRAGRTVIVPRAELEEEEMWIRKSGLCCSNDFHILALARLSGVRVLVSKDKDLHRDFTDSKILKPKGKVYQNSSHAKILPRNCNG